MNKLVSGAIGIEIKLDGTKAIVRLPDVLDLKGKRIKHIDYCSQLLYAPSGREIVEPDSIYLSLVEQNTREIKVGDLPGFNLSDDGSERLFINKIVDFPNSYLTLGGTYTAYAGKSLYFVVWFDEPTVWNTLEENVKLAYDAFEVPITSTTKDKHILGENRTLYNKQFRNILLYASSQGKTPKNRSVITDTLSKKSFLTLQKGNFQFFQQVPLYLFNQVAAQYPLRLQNISFDFTNSYIEFAETTGLTTAMSVFFNVILDDSKR